MSLLICSTRYGGCGYIGNSNEWKTVNTGTDDITNETGTHTITVDGPDIILCPQPQCHEDHAFALTPENYINLTDNSNCNKAEKLLGLSRREEEDENNNPCY